MSLIIIFAACAAISYLLGAVPFAFIIARAKGIDIRKVGSGNVGATNVFRAVSKPLGILTFFLDLSKGFVAACIVPFLALNFTDAASQQILPVICAFASVAGHNWPVFLRFKGGKGVATSAGALLGMAPIAVGIGLVVWILFFIPFRYVSLASIFAGITIPVCGWCLYTREGLTLPIALTLLGALTIWRHKPNIIRLLNGTENRFGGGKSAPQPEQKEGKT